MSTTPTLTTDRIDTNELRRLAQDAPDLRLLDVRTGGEFAAGHIPGSYHVPLDSLKEHVAEFARLEHPVVLICQSGGRASQAHVALQTAGKETLHILDGGMNAWVASGGEVTGADTSRWPMDRQVRLVAGSIGLASVLLSVAVPKAKWIAGGVGAGLAYSAVSNTCAMASVLSRLPYNQTDVCDIEAVLDEITTPHAA